MQGVVESILGGNQYKVTNQQVCRQIKPLDVKKSRHVHNNNYVFI